MYLLFLSNALVNFIPKFYESIAESNNINNYIMIGTYNNTNNNNNNNSSSLYESNSIISWETLYSERFNIYSFSEFMSKDISVFFKILLLISLVFYCCIAITLYNITKQRMAVPELINYRYKNTAYLVFSFMFIIASVFCTFYNKIFYTFSIVKLGMYDNIVFLALIIISLIMCSLSSNIHNILYKNDYNNKHTNKNYITIQNYILYINTFIALICKININLTNIIIYTCIYIDTISILFTSYYEPIIEIEKIISSIIILLVNFLSFIYLLFLTGFILTLQFNLEYTNELLQINKSINFKKERCNYDINKEKLLYCDFENNYNNKSYYNNSNSQSDEDNENKSCISNKNNEDKFTYEYDFLNFNNLQD